METNVEIRERVYEAPDCRVYAVVADRGFAASSEIGDDGFPPEKGEEDW